MTPFDTSCDLFAHGRPAMILSEILSPIPGSFMSSSLEALLRSTRVAELLALPLVDLLAVDDVAELPAGLAAVEDAVVPLVDLVAVADLAGAGEAGVEPVCT